MSQWTIFKAASKERDYSYKGKWGIQSVCVPSAGATKDDMGADPGNRGRDNIGRCSDIYNYCLFALIQ